MEKKARFYICNVCGKIVELISDTDIPTVCCGQAMSFLEANTSEGAVEKHVPVYEIDNQEGDVIIRVGSVEHPMEKEHYIMWIAQVTDNIITKVLLFPEQSTMVRMKYIKGATIYAYCNKHGLWKTEIEM